MAIFKHLKHQNLFLFALGLLLTYFLFSNPTIKDILGHLGNFGFLGALLAGAMFASTFTVTTGALVIISLTKVISPLVIILFGALGAVLVDYLIFRFVKNKITAEITPIYDLITGHHLRKLLHTRYFAWTLPVIGALIIMSPLPDELGVSLMGLSQTKTRQFLLVSGISHLIGMTLVVSSALLL